jgi:hypothetical protein
VKARIPPKRTIWFTTAQLLYFPRQRRPLARNSPGFEYNDPYFELSYPSFLQPENTITRNGRQHTCHNRARLQGNIEVRSPTHGNDAIAIRPGGEARRLYNKTLGMKISAKAELEHAVQGVPMDIQNDDDLDGQIYRSSIVSTMGNTLPNQSNLTASTSEMPHDDHSMTSSYAYPVVEIPGHGARPSKPSSLFPKDEVLQAT